MQRRRSGLDYTARNWSFLNLRVCLSGAGAGTAGPWLLENRRDLGSRLPQTLALGAGHDGPRTVGAGHDGPGTGRPSQPRPRQPWGAGNDGPLTGRLLVGQPGATPDSRNIIAGQRRWHARCRADAGEIPPTLDCQHTRWPTFVGVSAGTEQVPQTQQPRHDQPRSEPKW